MMHSDMKAIKLFESFIDSLNPCFNGWCTLTPQRKCSSRKCCIVLILVLMDDALWPSLNGYETDGEFGLNPCFNGWCTLTIGIFCRLVMGLCLNPCFNGWCTLTIYVLSWIACLRSLNPCFNGWCTLTLPLPTITWCLRSLNPCFNGWCTLTKALERKITFFTLS